MKTTARFDRVIRLAPLGLLENPLFSPIQIFLTRLSWCNMQKRTWIYFIVVFVILLVVVAVAYTFQERRFTDLQNRQTSTHPISTSLLSGIAPTSSVSAREVTSTPSTATTTRPAPVIPANWPTYTDKMLSITLRYPPRATHQINIAKQNVAFAFPSGTITGATELKMLIRHVSSTDQWLDGCYYGNLNAPQFQEYDVNLGSRTACLGISEERAGEKVTRYYSYTLPQTDGYFLLQFGARYSSSCGAPDSGCPAYDESKALTLFNQLVSSVKLGS